MSKYENVGHMSVVSNSDNVSDNSFYLPHYGIIKEDRLTTKLRTVFDGSMRTSTGIFLNDIQFVGPVIQSDLFSILIRFRKYAYVFLSDRKKVSSNID